MLAVVVLPCAPATAIVRRSALSSPSSAARDCSVEAALERGDALGVLGGNRRGADDLDVLARRQVLGAVADRRLEHPVGASACENGERRRSEP